jgi:hypothetical protein
LAVAFADLVAYIEADLSKFDKPMTDAQKKLLELKKEADTAAESVKKSTAKIGDEAAKTGKKLQEPLSAMQNLRQGFNKELDSIANSTRDRMLQVGQSFGLSNQQMAGLAAGLPVVAGGLTIVAAAGAAVTGALIGAGVAAFELAKEAGDAGSKIYDLSRNTNTSAESLSAFAVAADDSGASVDEVSGFLNKFNRLLGEAASGSMDAQAKLKQFGITGQAEFSNTDLAIDKFIRHVNQLPPGLARIHAAQEISAKSGAQLVSTFETMSGGLDEAKRKAQALGEYFTTEGAAAADEFGDKLTDVGKQAHGTGLVLGQDLLPAATNALDLISVALTGSVSDFRSWGDFIAGVAHGVVLEMLTAANFIHGLDFTPSGMINASAAAINQYGALNLINSGGQFEAGIGNVHAVGEFNKDAGRGGGLSSVMPPANVKGGGGGSKSAKETADGRGLELLKRLETENRILIAQRAQLIDGDQAYADVSGVLNLQLELQGKNFKGLSEALKAKIIAQKEANAEDARINEANKKTESTWQSLTNAINSAVGVHETLSQQVEKMANNPDAIAYLGDERLAWLRNTAAIADNYEKLKQATRARKVPEEFTGTKGTTRGAYDPTLESEGKAPPIRTITQKIGDYLQDHARDLSADITNIWANSLTDLYQNGVQAFFTDMLSGFAQMAETIALDYIEGVIGGALKKLGQDMGSGGGFFSSLLSIFGIVAGAAGGGGGAHGSTVFGAVGKAFAAGGFVNGPGTATSDSVPARLSYGEFVMNAGAVDRYGPRFMDDVNNGRFSPAAQPGGKVVHINGPISFNIHAPGGNPQTLKLAARAAAKEFLDHLQASAN